MTQEEVDSLPLCEHFTPEFWESQGFQRNWGDAAVMGFPILEILKKETASGTEFIILSDKLRRPVHLYPSNKDENGIMQHHGCY